MISTISDRLRGLVSLFWREVAKFGTVGGVAFVIDNGLTYLFMHSIMSDSEAKARFVGSTIATVFSWVANRYWTFRHRKQANMVREFVMFAIINGIGIGISTGFTAIAKYWLNIQDKNLLFLAGVVGIVVATVVRFFAYRFWVFNQELDTEPGYEEDHEIFEHEHAARSEQAARSGHAAAAGAVDGAAGDVEAPPTP